MPLLVVCIVHVGVEGSWSALDAALPVLLPQLHLVPADCMFFYPCVTLLSTVEATQLGGCRDAVEQTLPVLLGDKWAALQHHSLAEKLQVCTVTTSHEQQACV